MLKGVEFRTEIKEFNSEKYKKRIFLALFILVVGIVVYFAYFKLLSAKQCNNLECYENALLGCKKVWVLNEDANYIWRYEILEENDKNSCNVRVTLLKIKQANIDIEDFQGKEMTCRVRKVDDILPEKDMLRCNGLLKEKLQEIIIDRMHNYLLQNIGEISKELKEI